MGDRARLEVINNHLWTKKRSNEKKISQEFLYTASDGGGLLTYEQRLFYEKNGYVIIPDLVSDQIIDNCKQRFVDLCEGRVPQGRIIMMKEISIVQKIAKGEKHPPGEATYYRVQDIVFDDVFKEYFYNNKLLDLVECFIGPNIMAMQTMLINKTPDIGTLSSRHAPHQDLYYFPFRPANRIVATWTAMERVDESNGCLFVLPGSHKGELLQHEYPNWEGGVNKAFHGIPNMEHYPMTLLPMKKGETVFFHPLLIHGSGCNTTKGYRKALTAHYASADCHYIDVTGTVQEPMAEEILEIAFKRGLKNVKSVQDVWRVRAALVRGRKGTLI